MRGARDQVRGGVVRALLVAVIACGVMVGVPGAMADSVVPMGPELSTGVTTENAALPTSATVVGGIAIPSREALPLGRGVASAKMVAKEVAAESRPSGHLIQTILTLGVVIAVILLVGAVVRKFARAKGGLIAQLGAGGRAPAGVLEVLGRYPVSRGSTLVLLKLDRRVLLTCQTVGRKHSGPAMSTLCEIDDPEEVASLLMKTREEEGDSLAKKFQAMLASEGAWPSSGELPDNRQSTSSHEHETDFEIAAGSDEPVLEVSTRRTSEAQLSRAMSVLRSRVDSLATPRQPLAKGGRS